MADTVTSQTIQDGGRTAILKFTNESDGTGESSVKKVDVSEYDYSKIYYSENLYDNQYYSENFSSNEVNLKELEIPKFSFCIFKSGKNK